MKAAWIIFAAAMLSSCKPPTDQATLEKAAGVAMVTPQVNAPDWQKSKECAEQAEKVAADYQRRKLPMGAIPGSNWDDHYSSKGNRCLVEFWYVAVGNDPSTTGKRAFRDVQVRELQDAFERTTIAEWADNGCKILGEDANCKKAWDFISEQMKN